MDSFTENILARARQRQKELGVGLINREFDKENKTNSEPNLSEIKQKRFFEKETSNKENLSEGNLTQISRSNNSKTCISSEIVTSSSPSQQQQLKTLNIQNDNFNMEIKVTSTDDVRVEVQIEEHGDDEEDSSGGDGGIGLRQESKNRLNRLGKLYAGGDNAEISSPIHRTEAKFYSEEIPEFTKNKPKAQDFSHGKPNKGGGGLSKLADLARNMDEWEDDLSTPRKEINNKSTAAVVKKYPKSPAPQPPKTNPSETVGKILKKRAPSPPKTVPSPPKNAPSPPKILASLSKTVASSPKAIPSLSKTSPNSPKIPQNQSKITQTSDNQFGSKDQENATTKHLDWDRKVLKNLESQGFTRTESSSRLIYNYNKENRPELNPKESSVIKEEETKPRNTPALGASPKSPSKPLNLRPKIADRAAFFETNPPKTVTPTKDPALLSVSERKALFEKNKGEALIPKAAFAMPVPTKNSSANPTKFVAKPINPTVELTTRATPINQPEIIKPVISQDVGIAKKMAALLEKKSTISQEQIESKIRDQKQKEMEMLLNRFNKNKETTNSVGVIEEESEEESEVEDFDETTAMLSKEKIGSIISNKIPPPPPPKASPKSIQTVSADITEEKRRSAGKRIGKADSPKVAAVLSEVKRIKVSPQKAGRLYPSLSDIEQVTETENEDTGTNNSSFDENITDSDDGNTSFGRDVLEAVCKNQTPTAQNKRSFASSQSTESDLSDILEDMDSNYLDEALSYNASPSNGPTPPKQGRQSPSFNASYHSESFNYKSYPNKVPEFKSPMKSVKPRVSSNDFPAYVVDGDSVLPLKHTVSIYRKQQTQVSTTPVRQISRPAIIEESSSSSHTTSTNDSTNEHELVLVKIRELHNEVNLQEKIIAQTSQALNLCNCTPEFMGSTEQVEAEKVLLVATHRRQAAQHELQRLQVENSLRPQSRHSKNLPIEKGTLTISNIVLPLKHKYVTALAAAGGKGHHVVCLIKCGEQVVSTKLVSTIASNCKNPDTELQIPGKISLNKIYSDFTITFEVYCLQAQEEILPHEVKYHINNKKVNTSKLTPKKSKQESRLIRPIKESPGGPQAVRSPTFALMGYVVFSVQAINKKHWTLNNTPSMSPLEGTVEMHINCELDVSVEHRGFLTMFEDVSGFGAWHRRWCLLKGDCISYWKYPDDERKTPPIDQISLKNCITKQVGPVSRDICARLHTFLIERERDAYPQDKNTLVMVCKGDKTIIRHLLSADTKEERIEWCDKLNSALTALQMWGNNSK